MPEVANTRLDHTELEQLLSHLPYFVVIVDHDGCYKWVNRLDPTRSWDEVIGKPVEAFVPSEYKHVARDAVARCLASREEVYYETRSYRDGGYDTWYGCRVLPLPGPDGDDDRAIILNQDITDRKLAHNAVVKSEARFRSLVESSPDYIMAIGEERRILYVNIEPPLDSGLTREQVLSSRVEDLVAPADRERVIATIDAVLQTGQPGAYELDSPASDRTYRVRVVPLPVDDGDSDAAHALLVSSNITEDRRAQRTREAHTAELDHRVKNTLTTVLALASQTARSVTTLDAFQAAFTGRLQSMARTHEALARSQWQSVPLDEVVYLALQPFGDDRRTAKPCSSIGPSSWSAVRNSRRHRAWGSRWCDASSSTSSKARSR